MKSGIARYRDPDARRAYNAAWVGNKRSDPAIREQENEAARLRMRALYARRKRERELAQQVAAAARQHSGRSARAAAAQMRLHAVAPDGDLEALRLRILSDTHFTKTGGPDGR